VDAKPAAARYNDVMREQRLPGGADAAIVEIDTLTTGSAPNRT
jgi:hypothetical protein